jgi:hypothetical protein
MKGTPAGQNRNSMKLKVVQIPQESKSNGRLSLGYGESRIYATRMETQTNTTLDQIVTEPGAIINTRFTFTRRDRVEETDANGIVRVRTVEAPVEVVLDNEYDAIAFLPSREKIMGDTYDEYLFVDHFTKMLENLQGQDVVVTCATPGTITNPARPERDARWKVISDIATEMGVALTHRHAPADLPPSAREIAIDTKDIAVEMTNKTMFLVAARKLERSSSTHLERLHAVARLVLEQSMPDRLVTPLAVGGSLAFAEVAVQMGIPVTLVAFNNTDRWAPATKARLDRLTQHDLVSLTGRAEYEEGRVQQTVRFLDRIATEAKASKIVIDDPTGSEARAVRGGTNIYALVDRMLRGNAASASVTPATQPPFAVQSVDLKF